MTLEAWAERERRLLAEIERLRFALDEPQQMLDAIRGGRVDAFVVTEAGDERVYTLKDLHPPFQLLLEEMGEGAATLDDEARITYCNPHLAALAGKSRGELLGSDFRLWLPADDRGPFDAFFERAHRETSRVELSIRKGDEQIPVHLTGSSLAGGGVVTLCLVVTDLREVRRREELRAAKEAAEQANRAKDEFLATVSHEVRTPITSILGWIRMMQLDLVDDQTRSLALDSMHHSTTALVKIIDDILDIARLSTGKLTLELHRIDDFGTVVRAACEAMRPAAVQKNIHLEESIPEEKLSLVGDPDRLQQVFLNVLNNALKFTPAGGHVSVKLERADDRARVIVRDTGKGIPEDFLPHVFERFQQVDSTAGRGLGLGLAIVKQLVEDHHGSVRALSDGPGTGAMFIIDLPIDAQIAGSVTTAVREERMPSLQGISVLLVEDDRETLRLLRAVVESCGAEAEVASSGEEAIAAFLRRRPDVIVTDIVMSELDGFQLLERIRNLDPSGAVRAVAVTARGSGDGREEATAHGFHAWLSKPIEPIALARVIRQVRDS